MLCVCMCVCVCIVCVCVPSPGRMVETRRGQGALELALQANDGVYTMYTLHTCRVRLSPLLLPLLWYIHFKVSEGG